MCERCHVAKDEVWAEIRDLMDYADGPLSTALKQRVVDARETYSDTALGQFANFIRGDEAEEEDWAGATESVRCLMIAQRLAFVATFGDSHWHGEAPSLVLGNWANDLMQRERLAVIREITEEIPEDERAGTPLEVFRLVLGNMIEDGHEA